MKVAVPGTVTLLVTLMLSLEVTVTLAVPSNIMVLATAAAPSILTIFAVGITTLVVAVGKAPHDQLAAVDHL